MVPGGRESGPAAPGRGGEGPLATEKDEEEEGGRRGGGGEGGGSGSPPLTSSTSPLQPFWVPESLGGGAPPLTHTHTGPGRGEPAARPPACQSVSLSVRQSVSLSVHLSVCQPPRPRSGPPSSSPQPNRPLTGIPDAGGTPCRETSPAVLPKTSRIPKGGFPSE